MNSHKTRRHKFVEKSPAAAAILMCLLWFVLYQLLEFAINFPVSILISDYNPITGPIGMVLSVVIMMGVYKLWFRPEFEGMLKGDLPLGFLLGLIELIYVVVTFAVSMVFGYELNIKPLTSVIIFSSLGAGLGEEFIFRGVLISTLMRQWKDQNKFRSAALVSGIVFGLIHATNVFAGADPLRTLLQVIGAVGIGIMFTAVYLRSGSILPCMFYHTLHDIIAIAGESEVTETGIITASKINMGDGANLVMSLVLAAIALWLLRPEKNEEMRALWNRKWKLQEPVEQKAEAEAATEEQKA